MMTELIFIILLSVIVLSITTIFLAESLRTTLIFLLILYSCAFFLQLQVWPIGLAAVNLITGILIIAVINTYCSTLVLTSDPPRNILDILTVVFIGVITFAFAPQLTTYLAESSQFLIIGFFLFAIGLLQAGISSQPFRILLGLLIFSLGFQILYAPLEGSALVTALMSIIQIVLAFVVSRLIMQSQEQE